jgi:hypothetical protein
MNHHLVGRQGHAPAKLLLLSVCLLGARGVPTKIYGVYQTNVPAVLPISASRACALVQRELKAEGFTLLPFGGRSGCTSKVMTEPLPVGRAFPGQQSVAVGVEIVPVDSGHVVAVVRGDQMDVGANNRRPIVAGDSEDIEEGDPMPVVFTGGIGWATLNRVAKALTLAAAERR